MTDTLAAAQQQSQQNAAQTLPNAAVDQNHPDGRVVIPTPAIKKRPTPTLGPNGLSVAEYKRVQWYCEAAEGVTPEDILKPEYWAHVAAKMGPFHRIEVVSTDCTWAADLMVLAHSRTAAKVKLLSLHQFEDGFADISGVNKSHEIKHRGPRKWSIIRLSDSAVIKENFQTREEAEAALRDYQQALGM